MKKWFGSLNGLNLIEIGVGFGGQCKIIMDYFQPASYTLVDLPNALALTKKYLGHFNLKNLDFRTEDELVGGKSYDLVISNYAFTAFDKDVQERYLRKVFRFSRLGILKCHYMVEGINGLRYSKAELLQQIQSSKILPHIPGSPDCFTWVWGIQSELEHADLDGESVKGVVKV